jgi:pimeloyl-ACP methyl ester carboxylesterase
MGGTDGITIVSPPGTPEHEIGHTRDVNDRIVQANGVDLCLETFGDPADPVIVLSHGVGNSMLSWDERFCARLADGRRFVIRYDIRDAGRSVTYTPGAPEYTLRDLVADVVALLDGFGLDTAHFVGLSGGGLIGQLLALDHPRRLASLTMVSSTPGIPGQETTDLPGVSDALKAFFADEPPQPDLTDRAAVIEYIVESERPFAADFDEAAMRELATRVFDRAADIAASLTNPFMVDSGDPWRERLGQVAVPTLVVHGTEDPLFPLAHGRALADEIPGAELLAVEPMGHEYFPPATWDVVVPAILRHTAG